MTTSAFWAYGSQLQLGDGASPEVFSAIAEITELSGPKMERDAIEVTNHQSADGYKEFIAGMRDGGEVTIKANWLPNNATQDETTGLNSKFNLNTTQNWKIILPSSIATISFAGFLTAFEPDTPLTEQGVLDCTIKVTGKPTIT